MKRFMIVSKQRSGTNHFVSLLQSHPQIACYGEVFRDGYRVTDLIGEALAQYLPIEARTNDPDRFLDELEDFVAPEARALGFKVFPKQFLPVTQIARRPEMQIIRLVRPNLLATYSSSRIAAMTGQGAVRVGEEVRHVTLDFDAQDFERFMKAQGKKDDEVNKALEVIPEERVFRMFYSELGQEPVLEKLLAFLDVEPMPMTSNAVKRNPSHIVERFNDPSAVMRYLERHKLTSWAEE
ncbi:MAG: sulfotransferase [Roseovarius sp.]